MNERKKTEDAARIDETSEAVEKTQPASSPATDPTNPHNQEPAGDWTANERAAERRNNEPGLTDSERKQRRW